MPKKLGVLVIHGMGSQQDFDVGASDKRTYSRRLYNGLKELVGPARMREEVSWREVHWAGVLQGNQRTYLDEIKSETAVGRPRRFVMQSLSDAASYRFTGRSGDTTYEDIHGKVAQVLEQLEGDLSPDAPIMVFAHSLGGHIMSNYIYDLQDRPATAGRPAKAPAFHATRDDQPLAMPSSNLQRMKTVVKFVTFGCNIPVFVMGYPGDEVLPILAPHDALPPALQKPTWWHNYFDREDILGFPLAEIGAAYGALEGNGLEDLKISAGWGLASLTWASHNNYWHAASMHNRVAPFISEALDAI